MSSRIAAAVLVVAVACSGCKSDDGLAGEAAGDIAHTMSIPIGARVDPVGVYDGQTVALIKTDRFEMRLVMETSPGCEAIASDAAGSVTFRNIGNFGRLSSDQGTCSLVGTLDLEEWWIQRQAKRGRGLAPRATAMYQVVGRDDDWTYLRGRFPLLGTIGIRGGIDMITAIPHTELCAPLLERTVVQMEYRRQGPPIVFMSQGRDECPCAGVLQPQGPKG